MISTNRIDGVFKNSDGCSSVDNSFSVLSSHQTENQHQNFQKNKRYVRNRDKGKQGRKLLEEQKEEAKDLGLYQIKPKSNEHEPISENKSNKIPVIADTSNHVRPHIRKEPEDQKELQKKLRNRESALQARERKKQRFLELERDVRLLNNDCKNFLKILTNHNQLKHIISSGLCQDLDGLTKFLSMNCGISGLSLKTFELSPLVKAEAEQKSTCNFIKIVDKQKSSSSPKTSINSNEIMLDQNKTSTEDTQIIKVDSFQAEAIKKEFNFDTSEFEAELRRLSGKQVEISESLNNTSTSSSGISSNAGHPKCSTPSNNYQLDSSFAATEQISDAVKSSTKVQKKTKNSKKDGKVPKKYSKKGTKRTRETSPYSMVNGVSIKIPAIEDIRRNQEQKERQEKHLKLATEHIPTEHVQNSNAQNANYQIQNFSQNTPMNHSHHQQQQQQQPHPSVIPNQTANQLTITSNNLQQIQDGGLGQPIEIYQADENGWTTSSALPGIYSFQHLGVVPIQTSHQQNNNNNNQNQNRGQPVQLQVGINLPIHGHLYMNNLPQMPHNNPPINIPRIPNPNQNEWNSNPAAPANIPVTAENNRENQRAQNTDLINPTDFPVNNEFSDFPYNLELDELANGRDYKLTSLDTVRSNNNNMI